MNILITGAAQGIGEAIATNLATMDNSLILVDLQAVKLADTANKLRSKAFEIKEFAGDLTEEAFLNQIKAYLDEHPIDVLVNNAGVVHQLKAFTELSLNDLDLAYKVNVRAPFSLLQAALSGMEVRGSGMILNVASRANIYGYYHMAIYAATKAAITSLAGTVALDYPMLKAITIIPGRTNTPMQASIRGQEEANKAQSADFVGATIAKVITGEIPTQSGNHVLIDFGEYKVMTELDKSDLHRNMH